ncbi:DUF5753 domain-containing protein [Umezawaea sp. Da 62-37]|uniref:DUF5753 domain-containing protein n=1 Tax=Umezawaea sp. Da 62-37 TaxID=3075927 RepID=UPI0028F6DF6B|nr:DUF5753 domain-containing protein [Umezawaea sp. Da 62-37]WNV83059.1 DUF5753 domain-containing protein [Umezawaea sp. Da 62-37]
MSRYAEWSKRTAPMVVPPPGRAERRDHVATDRPSAQQLAGRRESSPVVLQRQVSIELRQMRVDAALERRDLVTALACSPSKIHMLETAERRPTYGDLQTWTATCARPDRLESLWHRTGLGKATRWYIDPKNPNLSGPQSFGRFVGLEEGADTLRLWDPLGITGLLQTADYAREMITVVDLDLAEAKRKRDLDLADAEHEMDLDVAVAEVEERVQVRLRRQEILTRPEPPRLQIVLAETPLRQLVLATDAALARAQLRRLVDHAGNPAIDLRVLPINTRLHPGQHCPFTIMDFPIHAAADPGTVYLESLFTGDWVNDPDKITGYRRVFDVLVDLALTPQASVEYLRGLIREVD